MDGVFDALLDAKVRCPLCPCALMCCMSKEWRYQSRGTKGLVIMSESLGEVSGVLLSDAKGLGATILALPSALSSRQLATCDCHHVPPPSLPPCLLFPTQARAHTHTHTHLHTHTHSHTRTHTHSRNDCRCQPRGSRRTPRSSPWAPGRATCSRALTSWPSGSRRATHASTGCQGSRTPLVGVRARACECVRLFVPVCVCVPSSYTPQGACAWGGLHPLFK